MGPAHARDMPCTTRRQSSSRSSVGRWRTDAAHDQLRSDICQRQTGGAPHLRRLDERAARERASARCRRLRERIQTADAGWELANSGIRPTTSGLRMLSLGCDEERGRAPGTSKEERPRRQKGPVVGCRCKRARRVTGRITSGWVRHWCGRGNELEPRHRRRRHLARRLTAGSRGRQQQQSAQLPMAGRVSVERDMAHHAPWSCAVDGLGWRAPGPLLRQRRDGRQSELRRREGPGRAEQSRAEQ